MSHSELEQGCSLESSPVEPGCAAIEDNSPQTLATADGAAEHAVFSSVSLPSARRPTVGKPMTSRPSRRHDFLSNGKAEVVSTTSDRIVILLRSRQVRVLLTCCCVLLIGGLVLINLQSTPRPAPTRAELADLELTDFAAEPAVAPVALDDSAPETHPLQPAVASNNIRDSRLTPTNFAQPKNFAQPAAAFPRGAWLTGQIESN